MKSGTITRKGQVTIPKSVRDALGLREHDRVVFVVEGDKAIIRPIRVRPLEQLYGIASGRAAYPGRDIEREAARRQVADHAVAERANDYPQKE